MIKAFVGDIGSGKTLFLVRDAQWFFQKGYTVYSNMPMWGNKKVGKDTVKIASTYLYPDEFMDKIKEAVRQKAPTLFVIDEATLVLSAYKWKGTDQDLLMFISQSRKFNIHIFYTSQRFRDVIVPLRENATVIVDCKKWFNAPFYFFMGLIVDKAYFLDSAKSVDKKQYIRGRKWGFPFAMKEMYQHYISHFVVMTKALQQEFESALGNPDKLTPEDIIAESKKHIDIQPPI
jgi:hypothetical protein